MTGLIIALDYDKTADADFDLWAMFARQATDRGHLIYIVTMRDRSEPVDLPDLLEEAIVAVIYTDKKAKAPYLKEHYGLDVDIWIDDAPRKILEDYTT